MRKPPLGHVIGKLTQIQLHVARIPNEGNNLRKSVNALYDLITLRNIVSKISPRHFAGQSLWEEIMDIQSRTARTDGALLHTWPFAQSCKEIYEFMTFTTLFKKRLHEARVWLWNKQYGRKDEKGTSAGNGSGDIHRGSCGGDGHCTCGHGPKP